MMYTLMNDKIFRKTFLLLKQQLKQLMKNMVGTTSHVVKITARSSLTKIMITTSAKSATRRPILKHGKHFSIISAIVIIYIHFETVFPQLQIQN